MNDYEKLLELLLEQASYVTAILGITVIVLFGVLLDLLFHLYKKYIKKEKKEK